MSRRGLTALLVPLVAAVGLVPAHAAPPKKAITGSYAVSRMPDPTAYAGASPVSRACGALQMHLLRWDWFSDRRSFVVPAAGTLTVTLRTRLPAGVGEFDGLGWDLVIVGSDRKVRTGSAGRGGAVRTVTRFRARERIVIDACNKSGLPDVTVSYVFRYA
ncbi:MAG: hypothetical protein M3P04_09470 [Actinomycetota bacterium]|nr:hypothetical protein [Actinomycetota bacterium]